MIRVTVVKNGEDRVVQGASVPDIAVQEFGEGVQVHVEDTDPEFVTWQVTRTKGGRVNVLGEIVAPPHGARPGRTASTEMSAAARRAIEHADVTPLVVSEGVPVRWKRAVGVDYQPADPSWRPAREGEACGAGAGGHSSWRSTGCGRDAIVTQETERAGKPYRLSRCGLHAGGRLPLPDGRVIEPVTNPLGGA